MSSLNLVETPKSLEEISPKGRSAWHHRKDPLPDLSPESRAVLTRGNHKTFNWLRPVNSHQRLMTRFALTQAKDSVVTLANFSEMGTQKTQATVCSIETLLWERSGKLYQDPLEAPYRVLVICPLS